MPKPTRTRQACDRCHSQKLRCLKENGLTTCARCSKAGTDCVFSPVGGARVTTPTLVSPVLPNHDHDGYNFMDWSLPVGFGLTGSPGNEMDAFHGDVMMQDPELRGLRDQNSFPNSLDGLDGVAGRENSMQKSAATISGRLSALFSDIDNTWRTMAPQSLLHISQTAPDHVYRDRVAKLQTYSPKKTFENGFAHAQILAEIYPLVIREACSASVRDDSVCSTEDCLHHIQLPGGFDPSPSSRSRPGVDIALISLLVASHSRLIDLFETMFDGMRTCLKANIAFPPDGKPEVDVPELKVGGFVPSKESSTAMQTMLLAHFLQTLGTQAGKLEAAVEERHRPESQARGDQLLAMQVQYLRERAVEKSTEFKSMREALSEAGIIP
ncbi:hypothetical protein MKZ38_008733 [Zalerion maritima]|uniref:Zn(2)-C6 fungal-type domain-containing protein n=1 Tax=Zalerion maritima TaxID=339359 RepID=A0AAD5WNG3_9PEZI|nr:hypothetical protein MKZ38_008733 [Zalerion maritima]